MGPTRDEHGALPRGGYLPIVCELLVDDLAASRAFWTGPLGFETAYQRPSEGFVYLQHPSGAQIMLCERTGGWETAPMRRPYGRGLMLQIYVEAISTFEQRLSEAGHPLHAGPREIWRRCGDREVGKREIFVQDPDGYLVMIAEDIGERAPGTAA